MPLPPALAARLAKRGLLKTSDQGVIQDPTQNAASQEPEEEIIAEDYDDPEDDSFQDVQKLSSSTHEPILDVVAAGCPNKSNIYHDCSEYCQSKWAHKIDEEPSATLKRKFKKLLNLYPLPDGWVDVWEPGMETFYFWNTENDQVSWLPPSHPKGHVSPSVPELKKMMRKNEEQEGGSSITGRQGEDSS